MPHPHLTNSGNSEITSGWFINAYELRTRRGALCQPHSRGSDDRGKPGLRQVAPMNLQSVGGRLFAPGVILGALAFKSYILLCHCRSPSSAACSSPATAPGSTQEPCRAKARGTSLGNKAKQKVGHKEKEEHVSQLQ